MISKRPSWDGESDESDDEEETSKEKSGLQKLDISDNKNIRSLPAHLPCLAPNLSKLIAAGCGIDSPVHISQLPFGLTILDLSRNELTKLDLTGREQIRNRACGSRVAHTNLLHKSVSEPTKINKWKAIAKFCRHRLHRQLLQLKTLNLSQNKIEELSFTIPKQGDQIEAVDCVLPMVQTLNLSTNALKIVPANIGKMRKLGSLDISGNPKIDTLPPELGRCSSLYDLKFNPQQIRDPPRAIVERRRLNGQIDVQYIRNFLKGICEQ